MDDSKYAGFFSAIDNLSKGDIAELKRCVGQRTSEARGGALAAFYRVYPQTEYRFGKEDIWFMSATLYAGYKTLLSEANAKKPWDETDFGWTLRRAYKQSTSNSLEKRFIALLDCRECDDYMAYKLRQLLSITDSRQAGVNWPKLLKDLLYWDHPDRFVQKDWAKNYFNEGKEEE